MKKTIISLICLTIGTYLYFPAPAVAGGESTDSNTGITTTYVIKEWHTTSSPKQSTFSQKQKKILKQAIEDNLYPNGDERKEIAKKADLEVVQVSYFFNNYRKRNKTTDSRVTIRRFKPEVVSQLNRAFETDPIPTQEQVNTLSETTNLTSFEIKDWFKNKKYRSTNKENINSNCQGKVIFSEEQLNILHHEYNQDPFQNIYKYKNIAKKTNLKPLQVSRWFEYTRSLNGHTEPRNISKKRQADNEIIDESKEHLHQIICNRTSPDVPDRDSLSPNSFDTLESPLQLNEYSCYIEELPETPFEASFQNYFQSYDLTPNTNNSRSPNKRQKLNNPTEYPEEYITIDFGTPFNGATADIFEMESELQRLMEYGVLPF